MYSNVELKIKVDKADLLDALIRNRDRHQEEYDKAKLGFKKLLVKELEAKLEALKNNKSVSLTFKNQKPVQHLYEYDDIISMLQFAQNETIELNHVQYKQYVQDEWDWMKQWSTSNSMYLSAAL